MKTKEIFNSVTEVWKWIIPILSVYPSWAKSLFLLTGLLIVASLVVFVVNISTAKSKLDFSKRPRLEQFPYNGFISKSTFREIENHQLPTGSMLHVVRGNISNIRETTVVLPINESFDFNRQRGPASVLAAFETHSVNGIQFYEYLDNQWPASKRPQSTAPGTTQFISLTNESHGLHGVFFVVTTQDRSQDPNDLGKYKNTPINGIDRILTKLLNEVRNKKVESIAMPLLGTGYATIQQTNSNPKKKALFDRAVLLLSIDRLLKVLADPEAPLRRAVLVVYSRAPYSEAEDGLWDFVATALNDDATKREESIKALLDQLSQAQPSDDRAEIVTGAALESGK